ncbi:tetratricopeptide repeat protein [Caulobacter sp. NIBR1757]|uniref:tetratricopeptide repeat protein n=1 Tax=Caulobacter sp. NIBR1757 TaxID=3016000 RepID=UPI0022F094B1|nr:tetratricopeptide repeat protein [Caulobacter sp. NIBR1757]WGM38263.1 hypothetical protein AMEJIAPC_01165 [Caulobacter sp. NIBR1757]
MPEPITLTVAAFLGAQLATAASGPLQGLGDRMFCRTVKAVQDAIGDDNPRNGDVHRAVRRAQALAVRGALRAYLRLPHPHWRKFAGYSPDDLERKITLLINQGLKNRPPPAPDPEKQLEVETQIQRVFTHPDPVDAVPAARRLAAFRELAEDWALADLKAAAGQYGDWDRFATIFRQGDPDHGGAWWPAFRGILAEEVKTNARVESILTQQGLARLLEGQVDIQEALKSIRIDREEILAGMRLGQEGAIAYALRESQRDWHGIQDNLGVMAIEGHEDQIRELPTQLVIARYRVVPYLDRGDILADLLTWARQTEGPKARGRLYVAPGGLGKTRLTIEALRQLDLEGWRCTFLAPRNTGRMAAGALADLMRADDCDGVCIVLDYAEGQQQLLKEACGAADQVREGRIRIVALARSSEGWWSDLRNEPEIAAVFEVEPHRTIEDPLTPEEQAALFDRAQASFTHELDRLGLAAPLADPTAALAGRDLDRPLMVAMAAFLAACGELRSGTSVLEQMYLEERRHWIRHLRAPNGNDPRVVRLHRLVTQLTLIQSATHAGALALTEADPRTTRDSPREREDTVAAAERLYGLRVRDQRWLRSVEPDLLGEHVAMRALAEDAHGELVTATLRSALAGPPLYSSDPASLFAVLARADRREHEPGVREVSARAVSAIEAMVPALGTEAVTRLQATLPSFSLPLANLALAVARQALALLAKPTTEGERSALAASLDTLANRLRETGDCQGALDPARRAVDIYQELAQINPGAHLPDLAASLNNLAVFLGETGDRQGAIVPARRAVDIYEKLAKAKPAEYLPALARSLLNLAGRLSELGDRRGALAIAQRAVDFHEELVQGNPTAYLPDLARNLSNLAIFLGQTGDREGALDPARRAVEIQDNLARANPAAHLPDLAMGLTNLASRLSQAGDHQGALGPAARAVDILEELARTNPAAYLSHLAASLDNFAVFLSETGDQQGALDPARRAGEIYEELARANPAAYNPDLAISLNNLANRLSETGDSQGALEPARRAVDLREDLARANSAAYLPALAGSLHNLAILLSQTGDSQGALDPARRAVDIRKEFARANPAAYLPDLARSLTNLAIFLRQTGGRKDAVDSARHAVSIQQELARDNPAAYLPGLAHCALVLGEIAESADVETALSAYALSVSAAIPMLETLSERLVPLVATAVVNANKLLLAEDQALSEVEVFGRLTELFGEAVIEAMRAAGVI